jgi:hypothetical protein
MTSANALPATNLQIHAAGRASGMTRAEHAARLRDAADAPGEPFNAAREIARGESDDARFVCNTLRLFLVCPRAACRKARCCRGHSRFCRDERGVAAPLEAHEWAEALLEAARVGDTVDAVEAAHAEEKLAYDCWVAGIEARSRGAGF